MISVDGVRKAFGSRAVLDGVSLTLLPGRILALVGPNGSGKSTLIKCLLGLTRPDAGVMRLDGSPIDVDGRYRGRIGYAPQAPHFPPHLTVGEIIEMLQALRPTDAVDMTMVETFGLRAEWGTPVGTLSGGWRQKVSLATAWLFRPDVFVLDEPTAGLDPVASVLFKQALRSARDAGRTLLITSHLLGELEDLADDVAFLADGRLRFAGPVTALLAETGMHRLEPAVAALHSGLTVHARRR